MDIKITDIISTEELQKLQDLFADATGVASLITFPNGEPVTRPSNFCRLCHDYIRNSDKGRSNCFRSDKTLGAPNPDGPTVRSCLSSGLWDAGASIVVDGKHLASWLAGQVRNDELDEAQILSYADEIGVDRNEYANALAEVPVMSREKFEKIARLLHEAANQMSRVAYSNYKLQQTIAEKEKAKLKLRKHEDKYRLFFDINQSGMYRSTIDGKILECNERFAKILGYNSADELMRLPAEALYKSEESRNEFVKYLREHKALSNFEIEVRNKQGDSVWLMENVMLNDSSENKIPIIQGTCTDITHLKNVEKALKGSESKYRMLVENAFDGIYLMRGRKYEYVNKRFTDITGYTFDEVTSPEFDFGILLTDQSRVMVEARYEARRRGEKIPGQYDIEIKSKDGQVKYVTISTVSISEGDEVVVTGIMHEITRRVLAEKALWESEERLNLAVASANIGLWDHNFVTKKIIRNDQWYNMLGYKRNNLENTKEGFFSLIHPDDKAKVNEVIAKHEAGLTEQLSVLHRMRTKDGNWKWIFNTGKIVERDHDGNPLRALGIHLDVDAAKKAEEKLRTSEATYRGIINTVSDAIYIQDEQGCFMDVNQSAENLYGYTRMELLGKAPAFLSANGKNNLPRLAVMIKKAFEGKPQRFEFWGKRKNGEIFPKDVSINVGEYFGKKAIIAVARDITDKLVAEEKLKESEKFQKLLNQITTQALGADDSEELFHLLSKEISKLFNADGCYITRWEEQTNTTIPYITSAMSTDKYRSMLSKPGEITITESVMKTGKSLLIEDVFTSPYQSRHIADQFPVRSVMALPMVVGDLKLGAFMIAYNSPHKFTREEAEQGEITARQISLIVAKAKVLEDLKESESQLKIINSEKDKFFSIIAHDIKSPFSAFLGLTEIMAEDFDQFTLKEIQSFIQTMRTSASNLYRLLENLLEWSQIKRGIIQFEPENLPLIKVVNETTELIQNAAARKEIEIVHQIPEGLQVKADQKMLETILRNLASNAVKYTPKGGTITFAATAGSDCVSITVSDTGIGMNEKLLENLFRIDVNTNRPGTEGEPSTGLGLMLCKEFVEKHGGKISVESELNKGSSFSFNLPKHE
jgi:PAS domain S-box-containing protein